MTETLFNRSGQLAVASAALYTATVPTIVKYASYVNVSAAAVTANLFFKPSGGTARRISPMDVAMAVKFQVEFTGTITMATGDSIEGNASIAASVDYALFGVQIT
jgi:hypothetical protein